MRDGFSPKGDEGREDWWKWCESMRKQLSCETPLKKKLFWNFEALEKWKDENGI